MGPARSLGREAKLCIRGPRWPFALFGSILSVATLGFGVLFYVVKTYGSFAPGSEWGAYITVGVFGLLSAVCWRKWSAGGRVIAEADHEGLVKRSLLGDERVRWDQVEQVSTVTDRNALGQAWRTTCHFRSRRGRTLLTLPLEWVREDDRDRLIELIRAKQGLPPGARTELEAAPPPEGRGTEPEAVTAGRGTELEADAISDDGRAPDASRVEPGQVASRLR